jgi:nucleoside-diphosphate-sugar epimerase
VTLLITGATGFIGRHLIRRLLRDHPPGAIVCLVKIPDSQHELDAVAALCSMGVRVIEGDLNDPNVSQEKPPADVHIVYHLAANTDTAATAEELLVNETGCRNLLAWLAGSLTQARVVYSSSIAVLDRDRRVEGPLNEHSPCVPRTEYGRSKLRGEHVIQVNAQALGCQYTILRLATVYGPGAKDGGLFDRLMKDTRKHRLLARLNWPGRTSIVHVDDVTAIMVMLAAHPAAANETYCIANPDAPTIGALAETIADVVEPSVDPVRVPRWAWDLTRTIAWTRSMQLLGAVVAQTTFWRLTLMIDDGFWFDTSKLQGIWTEAPKDLAEGLVEMLKYVS